MIPFIVWNREFETGIEIVDQQHRGLVERVNHIAPILGLENPNQRQEIDATLDALVEYAAVHFRTEESLMEQHKVVAVVMNHHKQTHSQFVDKVMSMVTANRAGHGPSGVELLSFLAGWLIYHILGEDQAMARHLNGINEMVGPEEAFRKAYGELLAPKPKAMISALVDSYRLLSERNVELARHNQDLEAKVRARTAELELARDAAEEGNRAKGRFIGAISHELRTPMNAIQGFASVLAQAELSPKALNSVDEIVKASSHLLGLINDLIDYSRKDPLAEHEMPQPFVLKRLLHRATIQAFADGKEKGLDSRLNLDPMLPLAFLGYPDSLLTILRVLIDNAVKFTEQGRVQLSVMPLEVEQQRYRLRFLVEDSGCGISAEQQMQLFTPFDQGEMLLQRQHGGLGLGLALAQRVARQLGGSLQLDRSESTGSCFSLELWLESVDAEAGGLDLEAPDEQDPQPRASRQVAPVARDSADRELVEMLQQLHELLDVGDTAAYDLFLEHAEPLAQLLGEQYPRFSRLISEFDFQQADRLVQACLEQLRHP